MPGAAPGKTLAKSTFKDNAEKWKVVGDVASDPEKPDHLDTGGNPGGFIQTVDAAVGGVMYWRAPNEFLGDQQDAYKGVIEWSATQSAADNGFEDDDIVLEGNQQTLVYDQGSTPPVFPQWGASAVGFLTGTGWMDATVLPATPATAKDLKKVLGHLDNLYIRAEYRDGDDTDGLDTVALRSG